MSFPAIRHTFQKVILVLGCLAFLAYLLVYLPLLNERRELTRDLDSIIERLAEKGYGMSETAVLENLRQVEAEIHLLRNTDHPGRRMLETDPLVAERLEAPFQYFEFDREKNLIISQLRRAASDGGVTIEEEVFEALPEYVGQEREHLLWVQLALANQVLAGAVDTGIDRIESLEFPRVRRVLSDDREIFDIVTLGIRLSGSMDSMHPFLLYLAMDAEQIEAAELVDSYSGKRALFIDRFVLKKEALDRPDDVAAELVINAFVKLD